MMKFRGRRRASRSVLVGAISLAAAGLTALSTRVANGVVAGAAVGTLVWLLTERDVDTESSHLDSEANGG